MPAPTSSRVFGRSSQQQRLHAFLRQRWQPSVHRHRPHLHRALATLPPPQTPTGSIVVRRRPDVAVDVPKLVPAPAPGSGPLLERRADRELPRFRPWWWVWAKTMPLFAALVAVSALGIFNYQKLSSSTVASVLYALRTNAAVRDALGAEIYFRDRVPWVKGTLNQVRGTIDIGFGVKGTKGRGYVRFRSVRPDRMGFYTTLEWSLQLEDGRVLQLLDTPGTTPSGPAKDMPSASLSKEDARLAAP